MDGCSIILGEAVRDAGGPKFHGYDPIRAVAIGPEFTAATAGEVDRACWGAWEGFHDLLSRRSRDRAELLEAIAQGIADLGAGLVKRAMEETGLAETRLIAERDRTVQTLRMFTSVVRDGSWVRASIDVGEPARRPLPKPDLRRLLRPLGPVAVFGASNFPLAYSVAGGDTASALAAGCPVVVKGHPSHPGTGEMVGKVIAEAVGRLRFHPGTFAYLHAGGTRELDVGEELVRHTCIRGVGFTGSFAGGTALARLAQDRPDPIPVFAEMGSTNPVFVLPGALAEQPGLIADRLAGSITASHGQMCTCPGLVFVIRSSDAETFARALAERLSAVPTAAMLSPRIAESYRRRLRDAAGVKGVEARAGSVRQEEDTTRTQAVLLRCTYDTLRLAPTLQEEIFGPAAVLVVCDRESQLLDAASLIQGSLTGTIWAGASDGPAALRLQSVLELRVGRLIGNGVPTGVEVCDSMVHTGPFPASNQPAWTSVGSCAIERWCRPVCFQNSPESSLPPELRSANPLAILRSVNGEVGRGPLTRGPSGG